MPKVGDRVIVAGVKIGNPTREGTCIGVVGRLINVRWTDGSTSMFTPGAGSVTFAPGNGKAAKAAAPTKVKKTAPKAAKKAPTRKPAAAKKPAKKKR
jgi:hypothetical protein